jgi:hypothetical protein
MGTGDVAVTAERARSAVLERGEGEGRTSLRTTLGGDGDSGDPGIGGGSGGGGSAGGSVVGGAREAPVAVLMGSLSLGLHHHVASGLHA